MGSAQSAKVHTINPVMTIDSVALELHKRKMLQELEDDLDAMEAASKKEIDVQKEKYGTESKVGPYFSRNVAPTTPTSLSIDKEDLKTNENRSLFNRFFGR